MSSRTRWIMLLQSRSPLTILLRLYDQVMRIGQGRPLTRYSRITRHIWVGGQHRKHGWERLQSEGITAVINLRSEHDDATYGLAPADYLYLPTQDNTAPSLAQVHEGVAFIEKIVRENGCVYVHCGVGVGRAPTLVAAYLVKQGMSPDHAWRTIRDVRPFIFPLRNQINRVNEYSIQCN